MTFIRQNIKLNFWDTDVVRKVADWTTGAPEGQK